MNLSESSSLRLLRLSGTALLVLAAILMTVMPKKPVHSGVDGIEGPVIAFELAATPQQVFSVLGNEGDPERDAAVAAMDLTNRIDFLFMIAYPLLSFAIAALLVSRGLAPKMLANLVGALALLMFVGDAIENLQLLGLSQLTQPAPMLPLLTRLRIATAVKWTALFAAGLAVAPFVLRSPGPWRWSAALFAVGGLLGVAGIAWRPGIEIGANVLALAWLASWIHALFSKAGGSAAT